MRRTKADRWERLVDKHTEYTDCGIAGLLGKKEVVGLLRREHRAMVRMVTAYREMHAPPGHERSPDVWEAWYGMESVLNDVIAILKRRAQ